MVIRITVVICAIISGTVSLLPEVSQEGLLQPFVTYSDVSLFHYHIPPEVDRVTWEFAAFMDDPSCQIRDVHILVQHGSYPVFSTFNGTFPSYIYNRRQSLHKIVTKTAFQPHDATILLVFNPLPGSWFAAAYIPNWNEQMQQQGIVHKCRYSLGSIAMWSQRENIETLLIGSPQRIYININLSYYRFYVPSHTWLLQVKISNCTILQGLFSNSKNHKRHWCIMAASLEARALPTYDPNAEVRNLAAGGEHTFVKKHPFSDSYYYLLVYTEGETELTISITTKECGGFVIKPLTPVLREARNVDIFAVDANDTTHSTASLQRSHNYTSFRFNHEEDNATELQDLWSEVTSGFVLDAENAGMLDANGSIHKCYPVLPLARIKHSRDFTDTFLVQGPEWYSTWVSVRSEMPVFTHLTLLPFTDIGGTLSIKIHMDELLMNATSQLITIVGCVRKGRPPLLKDEQLECEEELTLNASSAGAQSVEDFLLIPFPEPDTWYLALHVLCYYHGLETPCLLSQVLVSIDIRTQPCVYSGATPCGDHGVCQETHRGMFFLSSCVCEEGWRGWGCQDGQMAPLFGPLVSSGCLLTLSNVFFLPPIYLAAKLRLYTQVVLFTSTMVASVLYHACDSEVFSICVTRFEVLQFTDFFFSLLCFWVTLVSLACRENEKVTSLLHFVGVVIIAPVVQQSRTALLSFMVPMIFAVVLTTGVIAYRRYASGLWPRVSRWQLIARGSGLMLASSGLCLFALIQTKDNYKYVHSAWHAVIALSLLFLLPSPEGVKGSFKSDDARCSFPLRDTDSELIDVGHVFIPDLSSSPHSIDVDLITFND